jgi:hypothetical protein
MTEMKRTPTSRPDIRDVIAHDFLKTLGVAQHVTQEMALAVGILGRPAVARRIGLAGRRRPVLTYDAGGERLAAGPGATGELSPEQTADPAIFRRQSEHGGRHVLRDRLREAVLQALQ